MAKKPFSQAYCYMLLKDKSLFHPHGSLLALEEADVGKYRILEENSPAVLCTSNEVVPVSYEQYGLLKAIDSPAECYSTYFTPGKLAWGLALKMGDSVHVRLPDKKKRCGSMTTLHRNRPQYCAAVVRWIGEVCEPYRDIHRFGVEITVSNNLRL